MNSKEIETLITPGCEFVCGAEQSRVCRHSRPACNMEMKYEEQGLVVCMGNHWFTPRPSVKTKVCKWGTNGERYVFTTINDIEPGGKQSVYHTDSAVDHTRM